MAEGQTGPVTPTRIADDIGIVTISKPPVNPLSDDVCAGLLEAFDEFEPPGRASWSLPPTRRRRSGPQVTTSMRFPWTVTTA